LEKFSQQHKDLFFTLINQVWRLVSGPITMLLIPLYLSPEQQGYWYLFGSLAALSIFADLGFSNIILQFSAHEYAFLHFTNTGLLDGEEIYLKKLGSFSSGYLIFQIYTPLMHFFHGAVYSGKVGITIALVMAIFNMSNIWMYTIIPKMNMLISQTL